MSEGIISDVSDHLTFVSAPLSGFFRMEVHDEVYARLHLGFFGINVDFFMARICFKGSADYSLNLFQVKSFISNQIVYI